MRIFPPLYNAAGKGGCHGSQLIKAGKRPTFYKDGISSALSVGINLGLLIFLFLFFSDFGIFFCYSFSFLSTLPASRFGGV